MLDVLEEPQLFSYLKEFYYPDLRMSNSQFSSFDCISDKQKLYIELKSRQTHYDTLLIEQIKYEAIKGAAYFLGMTPLYINSTPEGIWQFVLSTLPEPMWEDRDLPATTEFAARGNKLKVVGYLHISDGERL